MCYHIFKQRSPSPQHAHFTESLSLLHLHLFKERSRLTVSASFFLTLTLSLFIIPQKGFLPESPVISVMTSSGYCFFLSHVILSVLGPQWSPRPLFHILFSLTNTAAHHSSYFSSVFLFDPTCLLCKFFSFYLFLLCQCFSGLSRAPFPSHSVHAPYYSHLIPWLKNLKFTSGPYLFWTSCLPI